MYRRQFTQFIALLAGGVAMSAHAGASVVLKSVRTGAASDYLSRDFFEMQLGREFTVASTGGRRLRLKAVESACCHNQQEQFHAIFEANSGPPLEDGIYVLERDNQPRMGLYLTRSERGIKRQQLVATINLQTSA